MRSRRADGDPARRLEAGYRAGRAARARRARGIATAACAKPANTPRARSSRRAHGMRREQSLPADTARREPTPRAPRRIARSTALLAIVRRHLPDCAAATSRGQQAHARIARRRRAVVIGAVERELARVAALVAEPFHVVFADGSRFESRPGAPAFTLRFKNRCAPRLRPALFGHVGLLDAYFDGGLDIEGDLRALLRIGMSGKFGGTEPARHAAQPLARVSRSATARTRSAKRNARFHYGLPFEFYRLWLDDPYMMYTCAYWREGTRTLEEAQANKIDHVCRKLRLAAGEQRGRHRLRLRRLHVSRARAPRRRRHRAQHHRRAGGRPSRR